MPVNRKKAIFYPRVETEIVPYYENAVNRLIGTPLLPSLAAKYNIAAAEMALVSAHRTQIPTGINKAVADSNISQESTRLKDEELADGKLDLLRIFKTIESHQLFDEPDAEALGFRKIKTPIDLTTVKPIISKVTVLDDMVILDWVKATLDGVIVMGSYDGSAYTQIGTDTKSPFEDTRPNQSAAPAALAAPPPPSSAKPEVRFYKMRYIKNDKPVGLFSDVVKVVKD